MLGTLLLLVLAGAQVDGHAVPSADPTAASRGSVRFEGAVSEQAALELRSRLEEPSVRRLLITSTGGDEAAALGIAEVVKRRRLAVTATGMCMSACSQIILLSSPDASVEEATLVGMHQSAWAIYEHASGAPVGDPMIAAVREGSRRLHDRTEALLGKGPRLALLGTAFARVEPSCMLGADARSDGQPRVRMRYRFWIPGRTALERAGVRVHGRNGSDIDPVVQSFARTADMTTAQAPPPALAALVRC